MNETIRKWLIFGGLTAFALLGSLTGWNGYAASQWAAKNEAPPTVGQVAGVALPGTLATAGVVASFVAWIAGLWKSRENETPDQWASVRKDILDRMIKDAAPINRPMVSQTFELLKAASVLIDSPVASQVKELLTAAVSANQFPTAGRIELRWPDKPPLVIQWGPPSTFPTEGAPTV